MKISEQNGNLAFYYTNYYVVKIKLFFNITCGIILHCENLLKGTQRIQWRMQMSWMKIILINHLGISYSVKILQLFFQTPIFPEEGFLVSAGKKVSTIIIIFKCQWNLKYSIEIN